MRNRVRIIDTKFNVDTVNKVVVCELNCDLQLVKMFNIAWKVWRGCEDSLADMAQECQETSKACIAAMDIELAHVGELTK